MSYQVLARKWRPAQFSDVVGQAHVVSALSNALDQNRVHHAFLFTGTRGVGKTTLARIFARALNCEQGVSSTPCGECAACQAVVEGRFIDLIEVDAASRTKVDDTRELLENVQYAPTQGRYKVYLIDEVHMLSAHSFNALLKTLEEPPEHVKFLLATTDPQKLPMTVLSRCIQFSLNAIEPQAIEAQLAKILDSELIEFEQEALNLLSRAANGSLRDALSLLDQAIAYSNRELTAESIREMLGLVDGQTVVAILDALSQNDSKALMQCAERLVHAAQDMKTALDDLLSYLHALALYQYAPEATEWKGLPEAQLQRLSAVFSPETLQLYYQISLHGKRDFALAPDPRTGFEMVLLRLLAFNPGEGEAVVLNRPGNQGQISDKSTETVSAAIEQATANIESSDDAGKETALSETPMANPAAQENATAAAANLAEEVEPFLENGLQNPDLQKHLKPASAITDSPNRPATAPRQADEQTEKLRAQSSYLPKEMMNINTIIDNLNVWSDFVVKIGLSGVARQLAVHLTPLAYEDGVLKLLLDRQYANLQSTDRLQQIADALQHGCSQQFKVEVELGEVNQEQTAAGVIAERERSNLEKTRQDFKEDNNVQDLVSMFDAEVDESSIKSVN